MKVSGTVYRYSGHTYVQNLSRQPGSYKNGKNMYFKGVEYKPYSDLSKDQSALYQLTDNQVIVSLGVGIVLIYGLNAHWVLTVSIVVGMLSLFYFADLLFNLFLVSRSFIKRREISISGKEIQSVPEPEWPKYTVFCPLYREHTVVQQFVNAMRQLDYPKDKLQIMLLLEENDSETVSHISNYNLPEYFDVVIVPDCLPKTKPKALNYGLQFASGEYVVIYDAEDIPDPDQLKKAVLGFRQAGSSIGCIQAKLNFYNPYQNILTKLFTAEYSLWFNLVLTGLQSIHAPIPLGGTSNHFRKKVLLKLKGWDSFNVTEDCDLGMRLAKKGYQTAILDSVTLEEANSEPINWFHQRTRWIKGYIQTYFQHMRNPKEFLTPGNRLQLIMFQLVVGGKVLSLFINPLMWIITISYFFFHRYSAVFIEQFFPTPVLYISITSLILGNFLHMYYYMVGCYRHGHHTLLKYMYFVPLYWLAMSAAGWVALYQFFTAPHHWAKTKHGLHLPDIDRLSIPVIKSSSILAN